MEFIITKEQIDSIKKAFFDINAPVQLYSAVVKMMDGLAPKEMPVDKENHSDTIKETK